uniref:PpiC domain-containing protein n=1 Tax=Chenopodium quinoa TaxID=63459 RepID=A0A803N4V2_CHEQI
MQTTPKHPADVCKLKALPTSLLNYACLHDHQAERHKSDDNYKNSHPAPVSTYTSGSHDACVMDNFLGRLCYLARRLVVLLAKRSDFCRKGARVLMLSISQSAFSASSRMNKAARLRINRLQTNLHAAGIWPVVCEAGATALCGCRKVQPAFRATSLTRQQSASSASNVMLLASPTSGQACGILTGSFTTGSSSGGDKEILVQHLLVKENDLNLLVELQKRVAGGEDLSDLAVEYSICLSKEEGGVLGWVRKGQMVPEFEEAAFSAPLDKVVRCKTNFGWHLLQVISEREEALLGEVQPSELNEKLQDPNFTETTQLIDVREPEEIKRGNGDLELSL